MFCPLFLLLASASSLKVLIVHPLYAGSHVLTLQVAPASPHNPPFHLQSVTEELLAHGHSVTTVKFRDVALPPLRTMAHPNFTLVSGQCGDTGELVI